MTKTSILNCHTKPTYNFQLNHFIISSTNIIYNMTGKIFRMVLLQHITILFFVQPVRLVIPSSQISSPNSYSCVLILHTIIDSLIAFVAMDIL